MFAWFGRMIPRKSEQDLALMRPACVLAQTVLDEVCDFIQPGITTRQIDEFAAKRMAHYGAKSAFLGYRKFPCHLCISVNEQVVHGLATDRRVNFGDIVSLDVGVRYNGFIGDTARTVAVGGCGVEAQRRFESFAADVFARHAETLTFRVGINTGEVVIGAGDADLVGDAVNVAARLEKACRPGQVLVGEETWRLTRGDLSYEPLGEVTVSGRAQAVAIYEVAAASAGGVAERAAPFVGRDAEMRRLLAVFQAAARTRTAHLVTVLGSPGVGKTRLSRELCTEVEKGHDAITFEIRCDRAGNATFAPIAQLIREATGIGDDGDATVARDCVGAMFAEGDADRERLADVLAGLVGAAPARSVEETFWAVRRLIESVAAARPMVVVIDDIQWAEPLLLDLLEHLVEWVEGRGGRTGEPRPA